MVRVLVVSHIPLLCDLIKTVLENENDLQVIECVSNAQTALERAAQCDIMVINANLPGEESFQLVQTLGLNKEGPRSIVFGIPRSEPIALRYLEVGASGCVHSDDSAGELTETVRAVAQRGVMLSPFMAARVMKRVAELAEKCHAPRPVSEFAFDQKGLTTREGQVLDLMARGYSNQDIARMLMIELGTTKNHVHNILAKLQAKNRKEAVTFASFGTGW